MAVASGRTKAVRRTPADARSHIDGDLGGTTVKLSVNVSEDVGLRLRQVAFEQRLSESSIVEVALALLFRRTEGSALGSLLRQQGATLRRKRKSS